MYAVQHHYVVSDPLHASAIIRTNMPISCSSKAKEKPSRKDIREIYVWHLHGTQIIIYWSTVKPSNKTQDSGYGLRTMTAHLRSYSTVLRREREDAALACLLVCLRCGALCIVHDKQHAHVVSACRRVSCGLRRHCVYATTHYYLLDTYQVSC